MVSGQHGVLRAVRNPGRNRTKEGSDLEGLEGERRRMGVQDHMEENSLRRVLLKGSKEVQRIEDRRRSVEVENNLN